MNSRKQAILDTGIFKEVIPQLFPGAKQSGNDQIVVCCPFHDDKNPSLSVNTVAGLFNCFACEAKGNGFDLYMKIKGCDFKTALDELEALAGITAARARKQKPKVVATFTYHDADGKPLYWKKRFEPSFDGKRSKAFCFYHGAANGPKQRKGRGGVAVPYNLHKLAVLPQGEPVYFLEGEQKADILNRWGLCATTLDSGGQSGKGNAWREEWNSYFAGRDVFIIPDNDKTGLAYQNMLAGHLLPVAASVKVVRLPGLKAKEDIVDWLKREMVKK